MHNGIKNFLVFSLGAAAGAVVTWKLLKTTYERIAQEEINSVYEEFSMTNKNDADTSSDEDVEAENVDKSDTEKHDELVRSEGYLSSLNEKNEEKGGSEPMRDDMPRVISPDEFEQHDDYDVICLTLYADGVLADLLDDPVEEVEKNIGTDYADAFGDSDTVYVQNDRLRVYYEISRDTMSYEEVTGKTLYDTEPDPMEE